MKKLSTGVRARSRSSFGVPRLAAVLTLVALPAFGVAPSAVHAAATWYVAPGGASSAPCGTSPATPCATITLALSQAASGDTISIAAGAYHELIELKQNVTLIGAGAGKTIIDGTGLSLAGTLGST